MKNPAFEQIAKRRAEIEAQRKRLQEQLARLDADQAKLAAEESELEITERVLGRLASKDASATAPNDHKTGDAKKTIPKRGTKRPEGIPTTREMIQTLLRDAEMSGKTGLLGRDLLRGIDGRWWPGVGWNDVVPEASRLVRKNVLARDGKLFVQVRRPRPRLTEDDMNQAAE